MRALEVKLLVGEMMLACQAAAERGADSVEAAISRCAEVEAVEWRGWLARRRAGVEPRDRGEYIRTIERAWKASGR